MARKERKYNYIYKITCLKNGKYYIGMHSTDNLEDGYMGGGKKIKNSIKKHGKDAHRKEIVEFFENREDLKNQEMQLVNENLLNDPMCMNLRLGGGGGIRSEEHHSKMRIGASKKNSQFMKEFWSIPENCIERGKSISKKIKNISVEKKDKMLNGSRSWVGRVHSEETKNKMSVSSMGKGSGKENSQFGTCWVFNEVEKKSIKIKKNQLQSYLELGWFKGRKMIF